MYRVLVFNSYDDVFADNPYVSMLKFDFSDMDKANVFVTEMVGYGKVCVVFEPVDGEDE